MKIFESIINVILDFGNKLVILYQKMNSVNEIRPPQERPDRVNADPGYY